jgi:type II secretory pathway pseudopilin PulG
MKFNQNRNGLRGFSLAEVVISIGLLGFTLTGVLSGYLMAAKRATSSGCAQAAAANTLQRIEQARAATWDVQTSPAIDELVSSNFPALVQTLGLPIRGTNVTYSTNTITITTISTNPPIKMIRSDTVWRSQDGRTVSRLFTNTLIVYRSPNL